MTTRKRTAVLISGRGTNLQALIDAAADETFPAKIALVLSNVEDAPGLERATRAGIATRVISHRGYASRAAFDLEIERALKEEGIEFVCLAGFMRIFSDEFAQRWLGQIINIHPSLLPAFKGLKVHRQVLEAGVRISGCTVHFVVPELDAGPIIAQAAIPVLTDDDEASLAARTLTAEHELYPLALKLLAEGSVRLEGAQAVFARTQTNTAVLLNPRL